MPTALGELFKLSGKHSGTLCAFLAPVAIWLAVQALGWAPAPQWVYVAVTGGAVGVINHFTDDSGGDD